MLSKLYKTSQLGFQYTFSESMSFLHHGYAFRLFGHTGTFPKFGSEPQRRGATWNRDLLTRPLAIFDDTFAVSLPTSLVDIRQDFFSYWNHSR